jgi:hypothetical protein
MPAETDQLAGVDQHGTREAVWMSGSPEQPNAA